MTKTITPHDIIRYLYKETSTEENVDIEVQKICNNEVDELMEDFQYIQINLNKIHYEPSSKNLKNILAYAQKKQIA